MSEDSRWRFALGERVGMAYAANPKARVVMVAGSTGRGTADRYSDLEIDVYWDEPPTDEERRAAIERAGGRPLEIYAYEEDEWAEEIGFGDFKVGTSTFLVETMERYLTLAVDECSTDLLAQMRLSSLMNARTLVGEDLVAHWREKAATYPTGLVLAMLREQLDVGLFAYAAEMCAARNDTIVLYDVFVQTERRLLAALLALNRIYLPDPGLKAMHELIGRLQIAPPDLAARFTRAFRVPPVEGVRELRAVIDETFALIEIHLPEFNTAPYRAAADRPRGAWDRAPEF